jgi:hypothetical protein
MRIHMTSSRVLLAAAVLAAVVLAFSATPESEVASPAASSVISFTPRGPTFRLEFMQRPTTGKLVLLFDSAATASVGLVGGDGTDGIVLLPGGLRVHNSPSSFGSYQLQLPLSLSSVHVFLAGSVELVIDVKSAPEPFRRELYLSGEQGR